MPPARNRWSRSAAGCDRLKLAGALAALLLAGADAPAATLIAHRGLGTGAPENSLSAIRASAAAGIANVELDVRQAGDGTLVILHDATLDRTTSCRGRVARMAVAALRQCRLKGAKGETVPTLAEALVLGRDRRVRLLLDIKSKVPMPQLVEQVRGFEGLVIGLRRPSDVTAIRPSLPGAATLGFPSSPAGIPAFVAAGASSIRLWSDWIDRDPLIAARLKTTGSRPWAMVGRRLPATDEQWRALHRRMTKAGAEAIITDRPDLAQ